MRIRRSVPMGNIRSPIPYGSVANLRLMKRERRQSWYCGQENRTRCHSTASKEVQRRPFALFLQCSFDLMQVRRRQLHAQRDSRVYSVSHGRRYAWATGAASPSPALAAGSRRWPKGSRAAAETVPSRHHSKVWGETKPTIRREYDFSDELKFASIGSVNRTRATSQE